MPQTVLNTDTMKTEIMQKTAEDLAAETLYEEWRLACAAVDKHYLHDEIALANTRAQHVDGWLNGFSRAMHLAGNHDLADEAHALYMLWTFRQNIVFFQLT